MRLDGIKTQPSQIIEDGDMIQVIVVCDRCTKVKIHNSINNGNREIYDLNATSARYFSTDKWNRFQGHLLCPECSAAAKVEHIRLEDEKEKQLENFMKGV